MDNKPPNRLINVAEMAALLKINRGTLYRYLRERRIKAIRIGGTWRFKADDTIRALSEDAR